VGKRQTGVQQHTAFLFLTHLKLSGGILSTRLAISRTFIGMKVPLAVGENGVTCYQALI
jgi:hypothetical protein